MRIYTRTGDKGTTGLFSGERVSKAHPRVEVYGALDEVNSVLGAALSSRPCDEVARLISQLQPVLFDLCADMATIPKPESHPRIRAEHIQWLEDEMDRMTAQLPELHAFILPGGTPSASMLHVARCVTRRAERLAVAASATERLPHDAMVFLNRLSDFLFVLSRRENHLSGVDSPAWAPNEAGRLHD